MQQSVTKEGVTKMSNSTCGSRLHAAKPCSECPWLRDTPPGQFPSEQYEALRATSGSRDSTPPGQLPEAGLDAPMFACHTITGKQIACAGWLAVEGHDHLAIRLAAVMGSIPADALEPHPDWPPLFDSYDEMAATQAGPDPER